MTVRVVVVGGYGNFGTYVARSLARDAGIRLVIAGRRPDQAGASAASLDP
ncbi:KR domain-containing protein [Tsuneonella dongtanensis]|nr:KR domain-containing protein [Tsuneonella dongtanensis]